MKKFLMLACVAACIFALGACGAKEADAGNEQATTVSQTTTALAEQLSEDEWVAQNREIPEVLPTLAPGDIELSPEDEIIGELMAGNPNGISISLQFRYCYYTSYGSFWTLVYPEGFPEDGVPDEYSEWLNALSLIEDFNPNGTADEMPLVTLVKHFRVPKHVFVAEVEKKRQADSTFHSYDPTSETQELPNADIIYTFDNDIINAYYSR